MIVFLLICLLGLGFYSLLPKNFPDFLKVICAPAIGLFIFGQIALILAFALGINILSILLSLFIYAAISLYFFSRNRSSFVNFKFSFSPIFLVSTLLIIGLSSYVFFTQVLTQKDFGLVTGGGGMYGDTALHSAYTSRLMEGEFPPQNTLFAGKTLVYPLANDLLSAILRLSKLNLNLSFVLPQLIFLVGFLSFLYVFCRKFMSDRGYLFTILFLFFGWGIGWFFFFKEWAGSSTSLLEFLKTDFTNNETYNLHFHNILTGLIWPERSFLPGIFLALWSYLNFLSYDETSNRKYLLINSLILGSLPFWHTHTFIFISISWLVFGIYFLRKYGLRRIMPVLGFASVAAIILALPFMILFFSSQEAGNFIRCVSRSAESCSFGWQLDDENFLSFWFRNSFLVIPFAMAGIFVLKKNSRYVFVPAFLTFLVANLIIFQPWEWDNIKLLTLGFIFFSMLAGLVIDRITKKVWILIITIILIPFFTISGILSVVLQLKNTYTIYDTADIDLANWARTNTKTGDVFVIDPLPNHPVTGLAGRLVYMGYPGHLWVHGIDYGKREQEVNQVLRGDLSVIDQMDPRPNYIVMSNTSNLLNQFAVVYQNQKYKVLKVS